MRVPARLRVAVAGAALTLVLTACSGGDGSGTGQNYVAGGGVITSYGLGHRDAAPAVKGTTLDGASLTLAQYRGKVVVLNFWASWCAPCRAEGPYLQALATTLAPKGVQFVGVDVKEPDADAAKAFLANIDASYPSLADPSNVVAVSFNGLVPAQAIPSTIIIDRTGHIAARVIGPVTEPRLTALLAPITAEPA